ncbi:MAG: metallophosphoesterase [Saprospiraceae bacterium]|nr:metallophosphoesterase [Candidatus Vicinibacter proximus]MBL7822611.1 metallophosphoesterase [Saprospiraceae bacterium]
MKYHFIILLFFLVLGNYAHAQRLIHSELLGRPTNNSITMQAFFDNPVEACLQYGTQSGVYGNQTNWFRANSNEPVEIIISNLAANTKYYYRMCYRSPDSINSIFRPEYCFHTQRDPMSTFSFVIQADPHLDEQSDSLLYKRCLLNQLEDKPDFMVDLGDIFMSDKLKNSAGKITRDTITYRCHLMRSYYENSCHSVPLFMALGNHEGESGWQLNGTSENIAIWGTLERKKYFVNPAPDSFYTGDLTDHKYVGQRENYYAWNWGNSLFIVIDPYWYTSPKPDSLNGWRWTLGKTQYDWLKTTLENSNATFKFVFAHQIIGGDPNGRGGVEYANRYEWGGNNLNGSYGFNSNRPGWYKPIKDLLTENRVTIFFHGHDHFFGKQEKNCLIYQEVPQPSHPNFISVNYARDYGYLEGQILPNSGHLRVSVNPNGVKVDYVRAYLPKNETNNRKNKDVSATYFIGTTNCYDTIMTSTPVVWNTNYVDELVFPNPFEKETTIEFELLRSELINICILNSEGIVVNKLIKEKNIDVGKYQIVWDGKDSFGNLLPSGMYFYSITGKNLNEKTGKIFLKR